MKTMLAADPTRFRRMTTAELRETFLLDSLFQPGTLQLAYLDLDRAVVGSAVPAGLPLQLVPPPELRAGCFCERRELGILNVGGAGSVSVDGASYPLDKLDCLYIGRGAEDIAFSSADPASPAMFYLLSYPAHTQYPTRMVKFAELEGLHLGAEVTCNKRTLYKAIYDKGIPSCQLVLGFTLLEPGSNWNTMPPHTHMRRSEIYLYFDLDPSHRVVHLMGPPDETRHLLVANREVVASPGWSIHSGVGTTRYAFCWGMGGENQAYDDMDPAPIPHLR